MVERLESDSEESKSQTLSTSKNIPKLDTAEILKRQGFEFEPPKEDITDKQQQTGQGMSQTTVSSSADDLAVQGSEPNNQQEKDTELAQEIQIREQEEQALKNQEIPDLQKQLLQIQQSNQQEAQQSNSGTDQNEHYNYGMSQ